MRVGEFGSPAILAFAAPGSYLNWNTVVGAGRGLRRPPLESRPPLEKRDGLGG